MIIKLIGYTLIKMSVWIVKTVMNVVQVKYKEVIISGGILALNMDLKM